MSCWDPPVGIGGKSANSKKALDHVKLCVRKTKDDVWLTCRRAYKSSATIQGGVSALSLQKIGMQSFFEQKKPRHVLSHMISVA